MAVNLIAKIRYASQAKSSSRSMERRPDVNHLYLFYLFATIAVGLFSMGLVVFLYLRTKTQLLRKFLFFYGSFTFIVVAKLMGSYSDFFLFETYPNLFFLFEYFEAFIGKFLVMWTLPLFAHRLFEMDRETLRNRIIFGVTLFTFIAQHFTEHFLNNKRIDQLGDYFEDVVFLLVVLYVLWSCFNAKRQMKPGPVKDMAHKFLVLNFLFLPGMFQDIFLADWSPIRMYPLFYGCVGLCLLPNWLKIAAKGSDRTPNAENMAAFCQQWGISKREKEIIQLIVQGENNRQIAAKLFISLSTVKTHLRNIFKKLEIQSRYQLIVLFQNQTLMTREASPSVDTPPKG